MNKSAKVVILNGTPRSGKSSIVSHILEDFEGLWVNIGVDSQMGSMSKKYLPGIGLRPGGEAPHLEGHVYKLYNSLYKSVREYALNGINVVVDVGHHDLYSEKLDIFDMAMDILKDIDKYLIGVTCPVDVIMQRRHETWGTPLGEAPEPVLLWQEYVHKDKPYDLIIDTSKNSPQECALMIEELLAN